MGSTILEDPRAVSRDDRMFVVKVYWPWVSEDGGSLIHFIFRNNMISIMTTESKFIISDGTLPSLPKVIYVSKSRRLGTCAVTRQAGNMADSVIGDNWFISAKFCSQSLVCHIDSDFDLQKLTSRSLQLVSLIWEALHSRFLSTGINSS